MIFKKKKKEMGDIRVKTKFAFLPTRINNNTVVWLHKYKEKQMWVFTGYDYPSLDWVVKERWL